MGKRQGPGQDVDPRGGARPDGERAPLQSLKVGDGVASVGERGKQMGRMVFEDPVASGRSRPSDTRLLPLRRIASSGRRVWPRPGLRPADLA